MRSYSLNTGPNCLSWRFPVPLPRTDITCRYSSSSSIGISIRQRQHQSIRITHRRPLDYGTAPLYSSRLEPLKSRAHLVLANRMHRPVCMPAVWPRHLRSASTGQTGQWSLWFVLGGVDQRAASIKDVHVVWLRENHERCVAEEVLRAGVVPLLSRFRWTHDPAIDDGPCVWHSAGAGKSILLVEAQPCRALDLNQLVPNP